MNSITPAESTPTPDPLDDLLLASEVPERYGRLFTPGSWEWLTRHRHENGTAEAFVLLHGRLYVSRQALFECLMRQRGGGKNPRKKRETDSSSVG